MSRKRTLLTLIVSICSSGVAYAGPLDSPDVVYIDGKPCNAQCQSYMTWSDRAQAARVRGQFDRRAAAAEVEFAQPAPSGSLCATDKPAPGLRTMSRASMAAPKSKAAMARTDVSPPAAARPRQAANATMEAPAAVMPTITVESIRAAAAAAATPAVMDAPAAAMPTITVESIRAAAAAAMPAVIDAPAAAVPTITVESIRAAAAASAPAMASAPAPAQDNLVALVLASQDIVSLADLNEKRIAISGKQSASSGRVSAALMAAGAADVQFSEAETSAIDRLTSGEVAAAVVLAPRDIAALFPEIAGFRTFRIPLAQKAAQL